MAKELSTAGFRVVVLEQGPWRQTKDFMHDEVAVAVPRRVHQRFQEAAEHVSQDCRRDRQTAARGGVRAAWWAAARCTSPAITGAFIRRISASGRPFGAVAGADLRDWPITYDDLEPYYTKAEWDLGISGPGRLESVRWAALEALSAAADAGEIVGRAVRARARRSSACIRFPRRWRSSRNRIADARPACIAAFAKLRLRDGREIQHAGRAHSGRRARPDAARSARTPTSARSKSARMAA